jgi:hypothetical protein
MPPVIGLRMLEQAPTALTASEAIPSCFMGVTSGTADTAKEYIPEPPIPWKALKTILSRWFSKSHNGAESFTVAQ